MRTFVGVLDIFERCVKLLYRHLFLVHRKGCDSVFGGYPIFPKNVPQKYSSGFQQVCLRGRSQSDPVGGSECYPVRLDGGHWHRD